MKIGGKRSQYYTACHAIAEVMLNVYDGKRRCVIFHGVSGSGKSEIADMMRDIFDAHYKNETKDKFDALITPEEANKQLYVHDEACMISLFSKSNMANMK